MIAHWTGPVMVSGNSRALCVPCAETYPAEGPVTDADRWAEHHASTVHPGVSAPTANRQESLL